MKRFWRWLRIKLGACPQCGAFNNCRNHVGMCHDCWNYGPPDDGKGPSYMSRPSDTERWRNHFNSTPAMRVPRRKK
jgi:hypothetical protein